jgi:hypothetical protein
MAAFRKAMTAMMPFDRAAFADDSNCTPLWPDTGRAMDRGRADAEPARAGWKCDLGDDLGVIVVLPEPRGLSEWRPPSGGSTGFGPGYTFR